jgi:hypothetical protein
LPVTCLSACCPAACSAPALLPALPDAPHPPRAWLHLVPCTHRSPRAPRCRRWWPFGSASSKARAEGSSSGKLPSYGAAGPSYEGAKSAPLQGGAGADASAAAEAAAAALRNIPSFRSPATSGPLGSGSAGTLLAVGAVGAPAAAAAAALASKQEEAAPGSGKPELQVEVPADGGGEGPGSGSSGKAVLPSYEQVRAGAAVKLLVRQVSGAGHGMPGVGQHGCLALLCSLCAAVAAAPDTRHPLAPGPPQVLEAVQAGSPTSAAAERRKLTGGQLVVEPAAPAAAAAPKPARAARNPLLAAAAAAAASVQAAASKRTPAAGPSRLSASAGAPQYCCSPSLSARLSPLPGHPPASSGLGPCCLHALPAC